MRPVTGITCLHPYESASIMDNPRSNRIKLRHAKSCFEGSKSVRGIQNVKMQAFLTPNRWWFASTIFPLVAGTFGPMASAFSICALAIRWRVLVPSGDGEQGVVYVDDPVWLTAVNATQLAIALISNISLSLNMAKRIRFSIAQPITIVGWYLSSFSLCALVAAAAGPLKRRAPNNQDLSQAFYYAAFSAGLYFVVASLMVVTVYGAWSGHYSLEFNLTRSQRTMMLQTISFLTYLLSGAAVYAHIENWEFLDAVYWADSTLLTIGLGDFSPATSLGKSLLFPYAIFGIIILGLLVASIRSLVLERGEVKIEARMVEKQRRRILKKMKKDNGVMTPVLERLTTASANNAKIRHDTGPLTERERRKLEFKLMRKVQRNAALRKQWLLLLLSTFVFLNLWLSGAAVFQAAEMPQDWSYYEAVYFSYTSLLTIGYGDIYPTSNLGKAFFVFWSLLAIPTLTILISNMEDTVTKGIRDLTLVFGAFTVLPGNDGVRAAFKQASDKIFKGTPINIFDNNRQLLSIPAISRVNTCSNTNQQNSIQGNWETGQDSQIQTSLESLMSEEENDTPGNKASSKLRNYRHYMLVKEIRNLVKHLTESSLRNYTFDEWAAYLKLIGEDESSPRTHRRARRKPSMVDGADLAATLNSNEIEKNGADMQWSWIGSRSPLMGNRETEWLLDRLTETLQRELEAMIIEEPENGRIES